MTAFREEQRFAPWVYWMLAATILAAFIAPLVAAKMANDPSAFIPVILVELLVATLMLLPLNLLFMVTEVYDQELVVTFGRWFPLYRKRIQLHDIQEARPVYYRPIWDAGGWGIRWGRFEGKRCAFLNARGDRGVFLVYGSQKRLIIGSQEPEQLADAIRKAAGMRNGDTIGRMNDARNDVRLFGSGALIGGGLRRDNRNGPGHNGETGNGAGPVPG